jgi:hypothetical protein
MRRVWVVLVAVVAALGVGVQLADAQGRCGHGACKPPKVTTSTVVGPTTSLGPTTTTTAAPVTTTTAPNTPGPIIDCGGATHGPVHLAFVTGAVIRNCAFTNADVQLYVTSNTQVVNNTFTVTDGVAHNAAQIISDFGTNNLIDGNRVDGGGAYDDAIVLDYDVGSRVTNNITAGSWDCGIEFVDKIRDSVVDANDVTSAGQCGIGGWLSLSMNGVTISNNSTAGSSRYAIYATMSGSSSGNVVTNNTGGPVFVAPASCCTVSP